MAVGDNKIIAEFMGISIHPEDEKYVDADFQYDRDWNLLMAVVERIESNGFEVIITESRCKVKHNTDHSIEEVLNIDILGTKKEAVYKAVVEFIKQHNNE